MIIVKIKLIYNKMKSKSSTVKNYRIISSVYFIIALIFLAGLFAPNDFTVDELTTYIFGLLSIGIGLWLIINHDRRLNLSSKKIFNFILPGIYNAGALADMKGSEKYFNDNFKEVLPKKNYFLGTIILLVGIIIAVVPFII
ncbi:MAG: hypothetical protein COX77_00680 [Candidatus Komeilibacteria bacterium CG_4_10_14_0_2_um_filter_37_10]|uniref:DUF3899 domain-containing protein n=1 Tax=Candidatus Komeilibacteria bacterium CG_4_10_14_0_2_um_filter_37_10 TaxID=1974470 RepID=A0A2M7VG94_9BACT|nr:MAG: hypothetical protein COX77_00680 [Candidatus Komeilibacteria bacterium CG_4_10_14_0_2_um_filter_37_10]PJA94111.1 MAG: hypothetical protein CO133_00690 [Candidatus Komeilibacteria bacterium CG_4_9_14_3_um_filter_37_5]